MPDPGDDELKSQAEHRSYFGTDNEEEPPESRYEPVEIDLGEPEPKKGAAGETPPPPDPAAAQLRAQLNEARQQTAMAQRQAMEQAQRAQDAEQRAMGSTVGMIDSALEAAQAAAANAKAKFQAALDAADHRTAAQAQEEMADARHNLLRLQEQRAYVEAEVRRPPQQIQPRQAPQQRGSQFDQITSDLVNSGFPRSADWLRSHHEWASHPELLQRISAADQHLVTNKGFVRETDEYFAALEQELGMGQQRRSSGGDYSNVRGRAAAAPTSNAAPSLRTGQTTLRGRIALSPAQQEAAELSGMSNREYAESFEEARVAGKLLGYR
jgi:hypothetical protein